MGKYHLFSAMQIYCFIGIWMGGQPGPNSEMDLLRSSPYSELPREDQKSFKIRKYHFSLKKLET